MKVFKFTLLIFCLFPTIKNYAQSSSREIKAGHEFFISLPDYMSKTVGLNNSATIQFKNVVKDIAGFIIVDSKDELKLTETVFSSVNEYYDFFITGFLKGEKKRTISPVNTFKKDGSNYLEFDASYFDKELKSDIYYYVCVVETQNYFYKILCWSSLDNKEKFKPDFQKIAYSLRE